MKLDHINVQTTDLEGTKDFFVRILDLEVGERPPFAFPGYWLYAGDQAVIHLVGVTDEPGDNNGALDHFAFQSDGMDDLISRLKAEDIEHFVSVIPGIGVRQVFFYGPEGVKIEVDFPPA